MHTGKENKLDLLKAFGESVCDLVTAVQIGFRWKIHHVVTLIIFQRRKKIKQVCRVTVHDPVGLIHFTY